MQWGCVVNVVMVMGTARATGTSAVCVVVNDENVSVVGVYEHACERAPVVPLVYGLNAFVVHSCMHSCMHSLSAIGVHCMMFDLCL